LTNIFQRGRSTTNQPQIAALPNFLGQVNAILHGTVLAGCATSAAWDCALHLLRGVAGMQQGFWSPQKTMVISGTDLLEAPYHI